jgi:hypothetical protein
MVVVHHLDYSQVNLEILEHMDLEIMEEMQAVMLAVAVAALVQQVVMLQELLVMEVAEKLG